MWNRKDGGGVIHTNSEVIVECKFSLWPVKGINSRDDKVHKTKTNYLKEPMRNHNRLTFRQKQWGPFYQLVNGLQTMPNF